MILRRKYSLCMGKVQYAYFSRAFAIFVTKFAITVENLKMKIEITCARFCGMNETAVATTPESKLQNAGFMHNIFVIGEIVLKTPKK